MDDFWELAMQLVERSDSQYTSDELERLKPGLFQELQSRELLVDTGDNVTHLECDACSAHHVAKIVYVRASSPGDDAQVLFASLWCDEAGRVSLELDRTKLWRIDEHRLKQQLPVGKHLGRRGRRQKYDREKDQKLVRDWQAAQRCGSSKSSFAQARGVKVRDLDLALQRERARKLRAH